MQEQLTPEEVAYQQTILRDLQRAKIAQEHWEMHLRKRYDLGPNDGITADGMIHRQSESK